MRGPRGTPFHDDKGKCFDAVQERDQSMSGLALGLGARRRSKEVLFV